MKDILNINAHLKYVEFLLNVFDNEADELTLREIRTLFKEKFNCSTVLLNQNFGFYRLLPLVLIKEDYKNQRKNLEGDIAKIKIIRDAVSHHNFSADKNGYEFQSDKGKVKFSYKEFNQFLHKIENEFYAEKLSTKG